jgi:small subunit ribosomal protein S5
MAEPENKKNEKEKVKATPDADVKVANAEETKVEASPVKKNGVDVKSETPAKSAKPTHTKGKFDRSSRNVFDKEAWKPKTELGMKVKTGEITDIDYILDNGYKILEPEIVDVLLPNADSDLLLIGQSKGKFGGGQRRVFRQTQKKTMEGNKPKFATLAVLGNKDGYFGVGFGKAKETVPAREKAFRKSRLNVRKIARGCGSWECNCGNPHTIPYEVHGKCGSVELKLMPAPMGTGLCIEKECAKILALAGIKDVWAKTKGKTTTKLNLVKACIEALDSLVKVRLTSKQKQEMGVVFGKISSKENNNAEFIESMNESKDDQDGKQTNE